MTTIRWRIVFLLLLATVFNYMDRVNLSFVVPTFMKQFHIGAGEMGIVLSAFLWTYFIIQIPMGMLLDRFGVRKLYGGAAMLWGAATVLTATVSGLGALIGWRVLLGVGEAPMVPASTKVLGIWVADRERGFAGALGGVAGIPIGVFIASPFIGWLLADFGWPAVFVGTGVLAVLWGLAWIAYYRNPAEHPGMDAAERRYLAENIAKVSRPDVLHEASWGALLSNRNVLGLSLGQAALLFNLYFLISWLPTYLIQQHHLTTLHTGIYGSIPWLFGLLGVIVGGKGSDMLMARGWPMLRARKVVLAIGMILAMASLLSLFTTSLVGALACLSLAVFGILLTNSVVWAANADIAPLHQGGRVAAIQNCCGNVGGLLAPIVVGFLLQETGAWTAPMAAAAVVALVGAALYFFLLSDDALFVRDPATAS